MRALAYLLPPLSGMAAYLSSDDPRTQAHGLQSILLGGVWPLALWLASFVSATATRVIFVLFLGLWVAMLVTAALGRAVLVPWLRSVIRDET